MEPRYGCEDLGVTTNGGVWIWMLQNINFRTSEVRESGNLKNWGGGRVWTRMSNSLDFRAWGSESGVWGIEDSGSVVS